MSFVATAVADRSLTVDEGHLAQKLPWPDRCQLAILLVGIEFEDINRPAHDERNPIPERRLAEDHRPRRQAE